jgi:GMP synthase-like glutamine amidotransferase
VTNQAYRIGRAVYATQFHFEADTRLVRDWNREFAALIASSEPDWAVRHEKEQELHGAAADAAGLAIARAWTASI